MRDGTANANPVIYFLGGTRTVEELWPVALVSEHCKPGWQT